MVASVSTRRLAVVTTAAVSAAVTTAAVSAALALRRVQVDGASMLPALAPGDRLLAVRWPRARPGDLVVVRDPRHRTRLLVKRVVCAGAGGVTVVGDNRAASTDSRHFGPVPGAWGRAVYRYHPPERAGWLRDWRRGWPGTMPPVASPPDLDRLLADEFVAGLEQLPMAELRARKAACDEVEATLSYVRRLVQGRLDIVLAEVQQRARGGSGDLAAIVEQLPEILAEGGTRGSKGRLTTLLPGDANHRLLSADVDRIIDADKVGALPRMDEAEVRAIADALVELERRVSSDRRALHERLDVLQAEIVRRYKSGEASVDTLLG